MLFVYVLYILLSPELHKILCFQHPEVDHAGGQLYDRPFCYVVFVFDGAAVLAGGEDDAACALLCQQKEKEPTA